MTPEDRQDRILELEGRVAKEWFRYLVVDFVVLAPGVGSLVLLVSRDVARSVVVAVGVVIFSVTTALVLYWLRYRISPLQREIADLKRIAGELPA